MLECISFLAILSSDAELCPGAFDRRRDVEAVILHLSQKTPVSSQQSIFTRFRRELGQSS